MAKYNYTQTAARLQQLADLVDNPDATPTADSTNLVTSGGVKAAIDSVEAEAQELAYASLMEDTASGAIASFPDGAEGVPVKELTADIEPIQDLHGQSAPYPPNGGKNKLPMILADIKAANTSGTWSGNTYTILGLTITVNVDKDNNVTGISYSGTASGNVNFYLCGTVTFLAGSYILTSGRTTGVGYVQIIRSAFQAYGTEKAVDLAADEQGEAYIRISASSDTTGLTFYPMLRLSTEADATFAPYSNICPILGFTGANITRTGKNIANPAIYKDGYVLAVDGSENAATGYMISVASRIQGGSQYYCSFTLKSGSTDSVRIGFYDEFMNFIERQLIVANGTFTAPASAKYLRISHHKTEITNVQIELGSTATAYEAYNGTVYPTTFSTTIYGGEYTPTEEENNCKADRAFYELDGTEGFAEYTDENNRRFFRKTLSGLGWATPYSTGSTMELMSSQFVGAYSADGASPFGKVRLTNTYCMFGDTDNRFADATAFNAWLADMKTAGTPVQISYLVATPTVTTETSHNITTLLGDNNIWSDTGDISVKYRCNTALYIEKKLGA